MIRRISLLLTSAMVLYGYKLTVDKLGYSFDESMTVLLTMCIVYLTTDTLTS